MKPFERHSEVSLFLAVVVMGNWKGDAEQFQIII